MTDAPQTIEKPPETVEEVVTVRRFNLPDLERHGLWLFEKLQDQFKNLHIAQNHMTAWIRGAIETNTFYFICTDKSVGMAQANHRPLISQPYVDVIFVHSMDENDTSHEPAIYQAMERWGRGMDAFELHYGDLKAHQVVAVKKSGVELLKIYHYFTPID